MAYSFNRILYTNKLVTATCDILGWIMQTKCWVMEARHKPWFILYSFKTDNAKINSLRVI